MPPLRGHFSGERDERNTWRNQALPACWREQRDDLIETLKDSAEQICSDILRNDDPDVLYGNLTEKQEDFNAFMESVPNKVLNALVNTFSALNITNEDNLKN